MTDQAPSPGRVLEFTMRPLPGRYHGAADHAFATWVRALDAALHRLRPYRSKAGRIRPVAIGIARLV